MISGHLQARADVDLDGRDQGEVFQDLSDTYDGAVVAKLYSPTPTWRSTRTRRIRPGPCASAGRATRVCPEVPRLDGVSYWTKPMGK